MTEQVGLSSQRHSGFLAVAATWLILGSASLNTVQAGDWPQWRGPRRDAVSTETGLLRSWADRPRLLWRASGLGAGYSSVVISNGLVFTMGKHGSEVFLFALEAETGQPRWTRPRHGRRRTCQTLLVRFAAAMPDVVPWMSLFFNHFEKAKPSATFLQSRPPMADALGDLGHLLASERHHRNRHDRGLRD